MNDLEGLVDAIVEEPQAEDRWAVVADWLEGHDDPRRAALLVQGVRRCVPQQHVIVAKGVEMAFNFVPPGSFLMGSPKDEEEQANEMQESLLMDSQEDEDEPANETQHLVTLTKGFYLGI